MAYTTIDNPELFFQTQLFSGNAGTNAITLDGSEDMQPDWVWLKKRNGAANNHLVNSVAGAGRYLYSNLANAEGGDGADGGGNDLLASFNSDGFTLDAGADSNASGATGVAWCWKAGTSFSNDASATSVGTLDSTGSINTTHGFSIISYTGNATSGATVAHGLGAVPGMIMIKNRSAGSTDWNLFHKSLTGTTSLFPDLINAADTNSKYFNDTNPTSSVFSLGNYNDANGNSNNIIAYCFAEKQGYSKFGSYTGNGNADGTFVYTGFRPAWIMVKRTDSSGNFQIFDNKRSDFNLADDVLRANLNNDECTSCVKMDILSNGFKLKNTDTDGNGSGATYVYMAFAEQPFVNSSGVPCNAR